MAHRFRQDYSRLELDDSADFAAAQQQYRRLVHVWHPDRFVLHPRERLHAEQQFIQLTSAFNNLRTFHRLNERLPFQPRHAPDTAPGSMARRPVGETDMDARAKISRRSYYSQRRPDSASAGGHPAQAPVFPDFPAGPLGSVDASLTPARTTRRLRYVLWGLPPVMIVATALLFVILDRNARQSTLAQGRVSLQHAPPSPFRASPEEVRNRSRRGVFLERENTGRIGDSLMPDVFR